MIDTVVEDEGLLRAKAWAVFSMRAFVMPMALIGYTALSVLRQTTDRTPQSAAASITFALPLILVRTACAGKNSQDGTCFSAAAWNTRSTPRIASATLP